MRTIHCPIADTPAVERTTSASSARRFCSSAGVSTVDSAKGSSGSAAGPSATFSEKRC